MSASANLASIAALGLLSHKRAQYVSHVSVANIEIQQHRRAPKILPNQRSLHEYVNLYFDARNPMMSRLMFDGVKDLIVVRVSADVLDLPGTIITDGNAAADITKFLTPQRLGELDERRVYAVSWNDPDEFRKLELKRLRCAEVLVPDRVHPSYIKGCYILESSQCASCLNQVPGWTVEVRPYVFFR